MQKQQKQEPLRKEQEQEQLRQSDTLTDHFMEFIPSATERMRPKIDESKLKYQLFDNSNARYSNKVSAKKCVFSTFTT